MKIKIILLIVLLVILLIILSCVAQLAKPGRIGEIAENATVEQEEAQDQALDTFVEPVVPKERISYTVYGEDIVFDYEGKQNTIRIMEFIDENNVRVLLNGEEQVFTKAEPFVYNNLKMELIEVMQKAVVPAGQDLVSFFYVSPEGGVKDMLAEGESRTYKTKAGKLIEIKVVAITDVEPRAVFEVNSKRTKAIGEKEQDMIAEKTLMYVMHIYPNEAGEVKYRPAIKLEIEPLE
ncbi:hypothetical protein KY325_03160 [Candidatus Woesearchaeota archaeon]|nr:hypothetical protein [Candidatus Woesearchaeota archaeon]